MRRAWRLTVTVGAVLAVGSAAGVSSAQEKAAAALVLELRGASTPALQPFTEIRDDAVVSLGPGARLVFAHYKRCRTVRVVGGQIRFGVESYTVTGGTVESDEQRCPRRAQLKAGGDPAGIILRSVAPTLPPQPILVLVGARAADFKAVQISKDGKPVVEGPLTDGRFQWPSGAAPLQPGGEYELTLVPAAPGTTWKFRVVASPGEGAGGLSAVLSVD